MLPASLIILGPPADSGGYELVLLFLGPTYVPRWTRPCLALVSWTRRNSALRDRDSLPWVCAVWLCLPPRRVVAEPRRFQPGDRPLVQHPQPAKVGAACTRLHELFLLIM